MPVLCDGGLELVHIAMGGLPHLGLHDAPHTVVQGVEVEGGGGSEGLVPVDRKVVLAELLDLGSSMGRSTILCSHIIVVRVVGLQSWQDGPPQGLAIGLSADLLIGLEEEWVHLPAIKGHDTQNHDLGWMLCPEHPLDLVQ